MSEIVIATQFSRYPAGRTDHDGPFNGTRFRETVLVPALRTARANGESLQVVLDGARSYGSSFLDEAFGGLVRHEGYSVESLAGLLEIVANSPVYQRYKRMIGKYLVEASAERARKRA